MTDIEVYLEAISAQLIKIDKNQEKEKEYLLAMVMQLVELNKLIKKLNYISGTSANVSHKEIREEMAFLKEHVDTYSEETSKIVKPKILPAPKGDS